MIRSAAFPGRVLAATFAVFMLAGCVKKQPTEVSPSYVPEGTPAASSARLIAYPDMPSILTTYLDRAPLGTIGAEDSAISTSEVRRGSPGTVHLMLFDGTHASAFEVLRRETGGGYFNLNDFLVPPARKWIKLAREVYVTEDDRPGGYQPPTYMMRGLLGGEVTSESPLSNAAIVRTTPIEPIIYTGSTVTADSNFTISWAEVPGAAGYWIQVYQFLEARRDDQVLSGVPAPAYVEKERDYFFGYLPAPRSSYHLGTTPADLDLFTRNTILRGQVYLVRIAAVDADGGLMAYTYGDYDVIPSEDTPEYTLFPLGAVRIDVRSGAPQASRRPAGGAPLEGVGLSMGEGPIVRR